ncbi:MAG: substrate-binding domain-containing protein, partial [Thiohalomonadaceae bacterium]
VVFADDDAAKQQGQVENFVAQGVDAIILNPVDKVQSAAAVDFAAEAGIPVITINTTSDSPNVTAHVGSDDIEAGVLQMERLLSVAPDNPRVAYINAVLGHSAQVFREIGYKQVLDANPDATLVVQNTADWSGDKALQLVENWIQNYPDGIDLIAVQADCILIGAITAVEDAGLAGKILLGGMDCDMPVMEKIKEGVVDNSIWQDGLGQGENALRLAIDVANGKQISDYIIPFEVCTPDNVDRYIEMATDRDAISNKYF